MAMLPFLGYNVSDYFAHWLAIGKQADASKLPRIYGVNWFRRDEDGSFLWPGYGENSRVLKWIVERLEGDAEAVETPVGLVPAPAPSTSRASTSPRSTSRRPARSVPPSGRTSCPHRGLVQVSATSSRRAVGRVRRSQGAFRRAVSRSPSRRWDRTT